MTLELAAIPSALLAHGDPNIYEVAKALDLEILTMCPAPALAFLPHTVAAVVVSSTARDAADHLQAMLETPPNRGLEGLGIAPEVMNFATYCSYADIVGVEESPLRGKALAAFGTAIAGGGVTIAVAAMATMAAPVAILLGAGSVVLFGAAAGVGQLLYTKIAGL